MMNISSSCRLHYMKTNTGELWISAAVLYKQQSYFPTNVVAADGTISGAVPSNGHLSIRDMGADSGGNSHLNPPDSKSVSLPWFDGESRFVNRSALWNVSYSLSPETHLLARHVVWENPRSLSHTHIHTLVQPQTHSQTTRDSVYMITNICQAEESEKQ